MLPRLVMIGAGNVGYQLGIALRRGGVPLVQVFSRSMSRARELARITGATATNELNKLDRDAGVYLIAVKDDAIVRVAAQLRDILPQDALVLHTSGATPSAVLESFFYRFGVFYPLQSISRDREPVWEEVPVLIETGKEDDLQLLEELAKAVSPLVHRVSDQQRAGLHVAAVFANNFTNHLFHIAAELMREQRLPFRLLFPLIQETVQKITENDPSDVQTGPALRGDLLTMGNHRHQLSSHPAWAEIYELLSESIAQVKRRIEKNQ